MELEIYNKGTLDREFLNRPELLAELRIHRIVEPFHEGLDFDMRVIPGERRDLMALPACSVDGSFDDVWYINLGIDSDDGAIYIGEKMFRHMANLVGYSPADELRTAYRTIEEKDKEIARLTRLVNRVRIVHDELVDLEVAQSSGPEASSGRSRKGQSTPAA